jgi:hypothetical protein
VPSLKPRKEYQQLSLPSLLMDNSDVGPKRDKEKKKHSAHPGASADERRLLTTAQMFALRAL